MIEKLTKLFTEFFESEKTSGIILIFCTIFSMAIANSSFGKDYLEFWQNKIGLEIERERYIGELFDIKNASLPVFAAIGRMATPALIHFLINRGTATQAGFGIPIATDIAFALGVLALWGNRVPLSIKIFLASLAIIDDLGSIFIIALFYMSDLSILNLLWALGIFAGLFFGKPIGILVFSLLAVKLGFAQLPGSVSWKHIIGAGFLGGIGFTMSIFITLLAFSNGEIIHSSKITILLSSLAAATVGFLILSRQKSDTLNDSV